MTSELLFTAQNYLDAGISVTFTDSRKVSIGPWKDFQTRFIQPQELDERSHKAEGIAIICGAISGSLEVIDIDLKYDLTKTLFDDILTQLGDLADKLTIAKTRSGGYHLYYRCPSIEGNLKLARRPVSEAEASDNPHLKVLVLIETRGEGGYVVAPPSQGYSWIRGDYDSIATITEEERRLIHEACRSFNTYLEAPEQPRKTTEELSYGLSPVDDYNQRGDIAELLTKHGWTVVRETDEKIFLRRPGKTEGISGDIWKKHGWFSVFTTSSVFEPTKAYNASAVFTILEANGDWTKSVQMLSSNGYGIDSRQAKKINRYFAVIDQVDEEGLEGIDKTKAVAKRLDLTIDEAKDLIIQREEVKKNDSLKFWSLDKNDKVKLSKNGILNFLAAEGYRVMPFDNAGNDMRLVHVDNNIIEEASTEKVKKTLVKYVEKLGGTDLDEVLNAIITQHQLFGTSFLEFLPRLEPDFLKDTTDSAYYVFRNGIVKVTREKVELLSYGSINKHIWRSHIKDFDIELHQPQGSTADNYFLDFDDPNCEVFPKFLFLISGQDSTRFLSVVSHVGYAIHTYKDPTLPVAIVLAEETDNDAKGGGTGKGIFITACNFMVEGVSIDGKNFRPDKNFAFQRLNKSTKLLAIQDIGKNFSIEPYNSILTEGMTVEKKGQQEIYLSYEDSPKIIFTTNYSVPDNTNHAQRRMRVIPFSDFFSPSHTPLDEFKHQLFNSWDKGQWTVFYNFMFWALRYYLWNGLVKIPVSDSMRLKALKTTYGQEFRDWFEDYTKEACHEWKSFGDMYRDFLSMYDMSESEFSRKRFRNSLNIGCQSFGYRMEQVNKTRNGGRMIRILTGDATVSPTVADNLLTENAEIESI